MLRDAFWLGTLIRQQLHCLLHCNGSTQFQEFGQYQIWTGIQSIHHYHRIKVSQQILIVMVVLRCNSPAAVLAKENCSISWLESILQENKQED